MSNPIGQPPSPSSAPLPSETSVSSQDSSLQPSKQIPQPTSEKTETSAVWTSKCVVLDRSKLASSLNVSPQTNPIEQWLKRLIRRLESLEYAAEDADFPKSWLEQLIFKLRLLVGCIEILPPKDINSSTLSYLVRALPDKSTPYSLPSLLSFMYRHLENRLKAQNAPTQDDQAVVSRLKIAADWSKIIEKLQKQPKLKPNNKEIQGLLEAWKGGIYKLNLGEKLLIPGGWFKKSQAFADALYEIEKTSATTYSIKVLSMSKEELDKSERDQLQNQEEKQYLAGIRELESGVEKYNPVLEFKDISLEDLNRSLEPLLHIQLPQIYQEQKSDASLLFGELGSLQKTQAPHAFQPIHGLELLSKLFSKPPEPSGSILMKIPYSTASKVSLAYMKTLYPNDYDKLKLEMELSALFTCINEGTDHLTNNRPLRDLIHASAHKLIHELEKNKGRTGLDEQTYKNTLDDLQEILRTIETLNQKTSKRELPTIHLSPLETLFNLKPPTRLRTLEPWKTSKLEMNAVPFVRLDIGKSDVPQEMLNSGTTALKAVQNQLKVIQKLYNDENFQTMELALIDLIRQLPIPQANQPDFWQEAVEKNGLEAVEEWHKAIYELGQFLFDCCLLQTDAAPMPDRLVAQTKLFTIGDRLLVSTAKADSHHPYYVNGNIVTLTPPLSFTNDLYLRFTSAGDHAAMEDCLKYIWDRENPPRLDINLTDINTYNIQKIAYLEARGTAAGVSKTPQNTYYGKMDSILPPAVLYQRNMILMMQGASSDKFEPYTPLDQLSFYIKLAPLYIKNGIVFASPSQIPAHVKKIENDLSKKFITERLRKQRPPIDNVTKQRSHTKWGAVGSDSEYRWSLAPFDLALSRNTQRKNDTYKQVGKYLDDKTDKALVKMKVFGTDLLSPISLLEAEQQQTIVYGAKDYDEMLLACTKTGESLLENTCATFFAHPELLNSPSRMRFFELGLFKQGQLLEKINEQPDFARELLSFAKDNIARSENARDISKIAFFMQLHNKIHDFIHVSDLSLEKKQQLSADFPYLKNYQQVVDEYAVHDDERRILYGAMLNDYQNQLVEGRLQIEKLSAAEKKELLKQIIKGYFVWKSLPEAQKDKNPEVDRNIQMLMTSLQIEIEALLANKQEQLNVMNMLKRLFQLPGEPITKVHGTYPRFSSKHITFHFTRGMIFENKKSKGLLPQDIIQNKYAQILLSEGKNIKPILSYPTEISFKMDPKTGKEVTIYTFTDQPNLRFIKYSDTEELIIQKRMAQTTFCFAPEHWYELQPIDPTNDATMGLLDQLPGELNLATDRFVWRQLSDPAHIIIRDETNSTELYNVQLVKVEEAKEETKTETWHLKEFKRSKDGLILLNPWKDLHKENALSSISGGALTAIEDPAHILAWGSISKGVQEFEFPRLKAADGTSLTYFVKKSPISSELLLYSKQHQGHIMHFESPPLIAQRSQKGNTDIALLPPLFRDFQLLEDPISHSTKVLIPKRKLTRSGFTHDVTQEKLSHYTQWSDQIALDPSNLENQRLAEYTLGSNATVLKTDRQEDNLFMAYIFFASNRYEQALEFLAASTTSLPLSPAHRAIYDWINQWNDVTPEGTAFKLKAALALQAHSFKQETTVISEQLNETLRLKELFKAYEKSISRIPSPLLLTDDEKNCYQQTLQLSVASVLEKAPFETPTVSIGGLSPIKAQKEEEYYDLFRLSQILYREMPSSFLSGAKKDLPQDVFSLTSDSFFLTYFEALYNLLLTEPNNSEKYIKYKQLIELASPSSQTAQAAIKLLKMCLIVREKSELPSELKTYALPRRSSIKSYRTFIVLKSAQQQSPQLSNFHQVLHSLFIRAQELEKATTPPDNPPLAKKNDVAKPFPQRKIQIAADTKEISKINALGNLHLSPGKEISMEKISEVIQEEEKVLQQVRVSELRKLHHALTTNLNPPPPPAKTVSASSSPLEPVLQHPQAILNYSSTLTNEFFNIKEITIDQAAVKKDLQFFDAYIGAEKGEETCVQQLAQEYKEDADYFMNKNKEMQVSLKPGTNLKRLQDTVSENIETINLEKERTERAIFDILQPLKAKISLGKSYKPIQTVPKRLIGLYVDGDMKQVNKLYGLDLTEQQIIELEMLVQQWMLVTIQHTVGIKGLEKLQQIQDLNKLSPEEIQELYQTLSPQRYFSIDPLDRIPYYKELLAIEFTSGFILKLNQVETIQSMLQPNNYNQVKQLGMGQGKSSVLLPMLLHHLANGQRLAIAVIPEWLYEIVSTDLDKSCYALFEQKIYEFKFDRNTFMDEEWLLKTYNALAEPLQKGASSSQRHAVITTRSCLLSFRNRFKELLKQHKEAKSPRKEELFQQLQMMASIFHLLKTRGAAIGDEIDTILDVRTSLIYALDSPKEIAENKRKMGIEVYNTILEHSVFGPKLLRNEQGLLSPNEITAIQNYVAESFFHKWGKTIKGEDGHPITKELFCSYICNDTAVIQLEADGVPKFMRTLQRENEERFQEVALLRQFISKTLPTTLSHTCNVHYGRATEGVKTIPYKANNTPSEAEFGEEFENIGYCIQDYLQTGINASQATMWINQLLVKIRAEMDEQLFEGNAIDAKTTKTYMEFRRQFPDLDPTAVSEDPTLLQAMMKRINSDQAAKLDFVQNWVFPAMLMSTRQVSSNANDCVDMLDTFSGFTGTTWNLNTFNRKMITKNAHTKGTDGKTVSLLLRMFTQGTLNIRTLPINSEQPLDSLLQASPNFLDHYDSLIDAGYYLKGISSKQIFDRFTQIKSKKKALVHITTDNVKTIQSFGRDDAQPLQNRKDIPMTERFTYYDQAHTIGTDIPHALTARAALTIGEKMYIKDLFQAIWRMRKIDQGQKMDLIISKEVEALIKVARGATRIGDITIQDIILFCIKNQAKREAEDNLRAERERIDGIGPQNMFWQLVDACLPKATKKPNQESVENLFSKYEDHLLKTTTSSYDALARVTGQAVTEKVLEAQKESLKNTYNQLIAKQQAPLSAAVEALDKYTLTDKKKLPEKAETLANESQGSQVQVQKQQQQQQQQQRQTQTQSQQENTSNVYGVWLPWWSSTIGLWASINGCKKISDAVSFLKECDDIRYTDNFSPENNYTKNLTETEKLLGAKRMPLGQVLVVKDLATGEYRYLILDRRDYEYIRPFIYHEAIDQGFNHTKYKIAVYDLQRPQASLLLRSNVEKNSSPWDDNEMATVRKQLVKLKILGGQFNFYDSKERAEVEKWVEETPELKKSLEKELIRTYERQEAYKHSVLEKTFLRKSTPKTISV